MHRLSSVLICALLLIGCGASAPASPTAHRFVTDGELYTAAVDEAHASYLAEVEEASQLTLGSEAEADALARTLSDRRLDHHLRRALNRRGLTLRGLRVYGRQHSGFVAAQRAAHLEQMRRADRLLAGLADHVVPQTSPPTTEQIAAR